YGAKRGVVLQHGRADVAGVDQVAHAFFRLRSEENHVREALSLRLRLESRTLRPIADGDDENISAVFQELDGAHELIERIGAAVRPGVHDDKTVPPAVLLADVIVPRAWRK